MNIKLRVLALLISNIFFAANVVFGQQCSCLKEPQLKDVISCVPIKFDNGASLYWHYNCDSSWLTFKPSKGDKNILFSTEMIGYTGKLGYNYVQEFKTAFLIENHVISGCCSPSEFYLFNKTNGRLKKEIGRVLFYSRKKKLPFIISLKNSSYKAKTVSDYDSLQIYNIDKNIEFHVRLPRKISAKNLDNANQFYPEYYSMNHYQKIK